jgi:large subunit ribosomal protein L13
LFSHCFKRLRTELKRSDVRTFAPKPGDLQKNWYVIDATDVVLGRLATHVAAILRGKNKPTFAPNADGGDFVIVVNADKIALSGNKRETKMAYRHSGFPGGLRATAYGEILDKKPELAIEKAVRGMLPKTSLGRKQLLALKVYRGAEHPHAAQKPVTFELNQVSQQPR